MFHIYVIHILKTLCCLVFGMVMYISVFSSLIIVVLPADNFICSVNLIQLRVIIEDKYILNNSITWLISLRALSFILKSVLLYIITSFSVWISILLARFISPSISESVRCPSGCMVVIPRKRSVFLLYTVGQIISAKLKRYLI